MVGHKMLNKVLLIVLGLYLPVLSANAFNYSYKALEIPEASLGSVAYGVNASGAVVGVFYDDHGAQGFMFNGHEFKTLQVPQATAGTYAYGINAQGDVVGSYFDNEGKHGFLYQNGLYTRFDPPNGYDLNATGINSQGQITGNYRLGTTGVYGFVYDPTLKTFTTLNNPKASAGNTSATGINDQGMVSGFYYNSGAKGFLFDGGQDFLTLTAPYAAPAGTFTYGLNNVGLAVGVYYNSKGAVNSYVFDGSQYRALNYPNAKATLANGINDRGQIVGYFTDALGSHGFIATPIFDANISAQLGFVPLQSIYVAGNTINITLREHTLSRAMALDLWVAVELPNGEIRYFNADAAQPFTEMAKPFAVSVPVEQVKHAIAQIVIPQGVKGHYKVYAIFTAVGAALNQLPEQLRSNYAQAEFDIR